MSSALCSKIPSGRRYARYQFHRVRTAVFVASTVGVAFILLWVKGIQ